MTPLQTATLPTRAVTSGTINAFTVFGVPVRLHFTFLLLVAFVAVSAAGSASSYVSYGLFLLGGLVSVLLHELGHALMASRLGVRTTEIVMFPIGGLSRLEGPLSPGHEIMVALAGPAVNLILASVVFFSIVSAHQPVPANLTDWVHPDLRDRKSVV